jgi:EAL domain-containing protein (putative c-di-GMP-specific phosphodiesterase class I)
MLHALGCRAAIDDFGAGFSSFRNLRVLDVDFFKIDGSFIENLATSHEDRTFVKALAELARSFGIPVVAEWVQDEGTVSLLADWGVDCIQGALTGEVADQPD